MKPVSMTITSLPATSGLSGAKSTTDDEARLRRDAERARLRKLQLEARQHTDAEKRLADAMARASARAAQVAVSDAQKADAIASALAIREEKADAESSAIVSPEEQAMAEEMTAPAASLLQRLARGQTRGLLQDCAPMIEAIAARLSDGSLPGTEADDGYSDELCCALEFLQGYADTASGRVAGADKIAKLLTEVRLQFDMQVASAKPSVAAASVAGLPGERIRSEALAPLVNSKRDHRHVGRKTRAGREVDSAENSDSPLAAGTIAAAGSAVEGQGKVPTVSESSLDMDQRKRRDDTLPLVTLRSI